MIFIFVNVLAKRIREMNSNLFILFSAYLFVCASFQETCTSKLIWSSCDQCQVHRTAVYTDVWVKLRIFTSSSERTCMEIFKNAFIYYKTSTEKIHPEHYTVTCVFNCFSIHRYLDCIYPAKNDVMCHHMYGMNSENPRYINQSDSASKQKTGGFVRPNKERLRVRILDCPMKPWIMWSIQSGWTELRECRKRCWFQTHIQFGSLLTPYTEGSEEERSFYTGSERERSFYTL